MAWGWIILIIIAILLFVAYPFPIPEPEPDDNCIEQAKKLIPERIPLGSYAGSYLVNQFKWNDGTTPNLEYTNSAFLPMSFKCKQGTATGQNANYCYTEPGSSSDKYLMYKKQVTDDVGQIIGYNKFEIDFIIDTNDEIMVKQKLKTYYRVVNYNIHSCEWVE